MSAPGPAVVPRRPPTIVFLSGKGGTGKTSVTAAFAVLGGHQVLADADVEAANLHILLSPRLEEEGEFEGSKVAIKDDALCTLCGECRQACRFDAIDDEFDIDPWLCEGCGACVHACPVDAIRMEPRVTGRWMTGTSDRGPFAGAELLPGEENSGKLVTLVRRKAREIADRVETPWVLVDGPPGIGCPVIASVTGVDGAVLVTEPTVSGLHDVERALGVVRHFGAPAALVINRWDLSPRTADRIEAWAAGEGLPVLGRVPWDPAVPRAMVAGRSVVETEPDSPASRALRDAYERFRQLVLG